MRTIDYELDATGTPSVVGQNELLADRAGRLERIADFRDRSELRRAWEDFKSSSRRIWRAMKSKIRITVSIRVGFF